MHLTSLTLSPPPRVNTALKSKPERWRGTVIGPPDDDPRPLKIEGLGPDDKALIIEDGDMLIKQDTGI